MAWRKQKGDLAELAVATDLVRQGHKVAIPFGEDCDYDLIVDRHGALERIQVKHVTSDGKLVCLNTRSQTIVRGKVVAIKRYTAAMIDWLAAYDATTGRCFYVPSVELGEGRRSIHIRLVPPSYNRTKDIRFADRYESIDAQADWTDATQSVEPLKLGSARPLGSPGAAPASEHEDA